MQEQYQYDKCLWAQIWFLDHGEGCNASNEYFVQFLNVCLNTVSNSLKKLSDLNLIYSPGFRNRRKIWKSSIDFGRVHSQKLGEYIPKNCGPIVPVNKDGSGNGNSPIYIDNTVSRKTKEKDILSGKPDGEPISFEIGSRVIVKLLNILAETHFREDAKGTRTLIAARVKDGATLLDFEKVIKIKVEQWADDEKMVGYLRPETLFARNHFESYRNEYEVKYDRD